MKMSLTYLSTSELNSKSINMDKFEKKFELLINMQKACELI